MGQVILPLCMSSNFWLDAEHYVVECVHFAFFLKDLEVCFGTQLSYLRICFYPSEVCAQALLGRIYSCSYSGTLQSWY